MFSDYIISRLWVQGKITQVFWRTVDIEGHNTCTCIAHLFLIYPYFFLLLLLSDCRYYYKCKIFAIVEGKRLVYKFGSRATGWKPRPGQDSSSSTSSAGERASIWCGPSRRCFKCLCIFPSEAALKVGSLYPIPIQWTSLVIMFFWHFDNRS